MKTCHTETTAACACVRVCVRVCVCLTYVCVRFDYLALPQCKNIQSISQIHQAISVKLVSSMIYGCQRFNFSSCHAPTHSHPLPNLFTPLPPPPLRIYQRLSTKRCLQLCSEISRTSLINQKGFDLSRHRQRL